MSSDTSYCFASLSILSSPSTLETIYLANCVLSLANCDKSQKSNPATAISPLCLFTEVISGKSPSDIITLPPCKFILTVSKSICLSSLLKLNLTVLMLGASYISSKSSGAYLPIVSFALLPVPISNTPPCFIQSISARDCSFDKSLILKLLIIIISNCSSPEYDLGKEPAARLTVFKFISPKFIATSLK